MKLSWSKKLFLRINKTIGKRPWLDTLMYFSGQWLIFVMAGFLVFSYLFFYDFTFDHVPFVFISNGIFAYIISYTIAIIFRHPRPIRELPNVKELIIPLETWKSFPSDHTIAVTLMTLYSLELDSNIIFVPILIAAFFVMSARVYCGVHYPRDIIGGMLVAFFSYFITLYIYMLYFVERSYELF